MVLSWLKRAASRPAPAPSNLFCSRDELLKSLARERLRCDRGGNPLALVLIELRARQTDALDRLARLLHGRLRATDEVGLLEPYRIGILLPDTAVPGALKVANDLLDLASAETLPIALRVLAYPDDDGAGGGSPDDPFRAESMQEWFAQPMPAWKRLVDIAGASLALVALSPVLLSAMAAVKVTSRGPIFFSQRRAGLGSRPFTMHKLRTMVVDAERLKDSLRELNEQDGPAFKIKSDPRITSIGRWLRKTSIDELPQLWNVLRGEMSLVGPRPLPCDESQACDRWQKRRLDVTPGLTCIWQVRGRSKVTFAEWVRMDIEYLGSRSLLCDLGLLLATIPAVLRGRGAQ